MTRLDSIADPVRLSIARFLGAHPSSTATEVAAGAGVHLNTARSHLAALEEAGIAERRAERLGVGRPAVRFNLSRGWRPSGDELLGLASFLAALLSSGGERAALRRAAADWGRRWAREASGQSRERRLLGALRRLGFEAELEPGELRLSACPCPLIAPEDPPMVCALIDAVVDGVLDGSGASAGPRRHDPRARRCSAELSMATN
jgi:predicted ArsR family transcriptional regulator